MWAVAQRRVQDVLPGLHIEAGERALVEVSRKFEPQGKQAPVPSVLRVRFCMPICHACAQGGGWGGAAFCCRRLDYNPLPRPRWRPSS